MSKKTSNRRDKLGEYIAEVKGIGNNVKFNLRELEIKHLRRCLRYYDSSYGKDYPNYKEMRKDDLTRGLYWKFIKFGRLKNLLSVEKKKAILKDVERKCSQPGCEEKTFLTVAHIKSRASSVNNNEKENLKLLCPKHHLLFDLNQVLWRKNLEIEKLKRRIEDIEQRNTTDVLGMGVLKDNKFTDIDADEI